MKDQKYLVLYDGTCVFCDKSSAAVLKIVPRSKVERQNINDPLIQAQYPTITPDAAQKWMHVVAPGGTISRGAAAVRVILAQGPLTRPLSWLWYVPGVSWIAERVYDLIAANRYRFMGKKTLAACTDEACQIHLGLKTRQPEMNLK